MIKKFGFAGRVVGALHQHGHLLRRLAMAGVVSFGGLGVLVVGGVANVTPAGATTTLSGTVQCTNDDVEGVWIQASNGESGWAHWTSLDQGTSQASYSYSLPKLVSWTAHVGCGGTPAHWEFSPDGNATTTHSTAYWLCSTPDAGTGRNYCYITSY